MLPLKPVKMVGWYDLEQITRTIMFWERNRKVFKSNEVVVETTDADAKKSPKRNDVSFDRHPDATYPNACKVLLASDPAPADHDKAWSGQMAVGGAVKDVVLYRSRLAP